MDYPSIDILEDEIIQMRGSVLETLLLDRTTQENILWATGDYVDYCDEFKPETSIQVRHITGPHGKLIQPRVLKDASNQTNRTRDKAEVFTPSWICNAQNNLVDEAWFGRKDIFNIMSGQTWETISEPVVFPNTKNRTWKDYVDARRMEVSCGEAPYLASRYDTVTGKPIPVDDRIGLLDRKLRIVTENTTSYEDWFHWTERAFQSIYGYEFQGDSLLLARETLLYSFIDRSLLYFEHTPTKKELERIAMIISWNIWQMDGLTYTVPFKKRKEQSLMDWSSEDAEEKPYYCKIRDWRTKQTNEYRLIVK